MPGSAVSYATHSSAGSTKSNRAKTRQYRTVSHKSQVDESLFGNSKPAKNTNANNTEEDIFAEIQPSKPKSSSRRLKKETVQVVTKDLIRNLIVPTEDPSGKSVIMSYNEFLAMKERALVMTAAEKAEREEQRKREKLEKAEASQERKNFISSMELQRQQNEPLNDLEEEAKERAQHLLVKANEQRQEQEDEIKHLNEMILNAKCHAIRDAQILEKKVINTEMQSEEKRLDQMMEIDRVNSLKMQEEIERKRREERLVGATQILEQIADNEQERLFELERKDQENIQMQKYLEKLMDEDRVKLERKAQEQTLLREQLNAANDALLERKQLQSEQDKILELRVLEYQREKAEREAAYEKEQELIRIEKEKETARLRGLQERAQDEQAARDALRAKRAAEAAEREWRRKEAEEARKKAMVEASLKQARSQQMEQKEHFLAVQGQRERNDFERVLRAQKELIEKEQREEEVKHKQRIVHRDDVLDQIREKEHLKIAERNTFFEEGVKLDEEARLRRLKIDEVKSKKLAELRNVGIPEKYLAQVERKVAHQQVAH